MLLLFALQEKTALTHQPDNNGHQLLYIAQACKEE